MSHCVMPASDPFWRKAASSHIANRDQQLLLRISKSSSRLHQDYHVIELAVCFRSFLFPTFCAFLLARANTCLRILLLC